MGARFSQIYEIKHINETDSLHYQLDRAVFEKSDIVHIYMRAMTGYESVDLLLQQISNWSPKGQKWIDWEVTSTRTGSIFSKSWSLAPDVLILTLSKPVE
jgi:hypothetical protein